MTMLSFITSNLTNYAKYFFGIEDTSCTPRVFSLQNDGTYASSSSESPNAQTVRLPKLLTLSRDIQLLIADFLIDRGNGKFFKKGDNLSFFHTCKALNSCLRPFISRDDRDVAGDILCNVSDLTRLEKLVRKLPCTKVVKLDLAHNPFPEHYYKRIAASFPNVHTLALSNCISKSTFGAFATGGNLKALSISETVFKYSESLDQLHSLTALSFIRCHMSSDMIATIGLKFKDLEYLQLKYTYSLEEGGFRSHDVRKLSNLSKLETLKISGLSFLLEDIAKIESLTSLDISNCDISNPDFNNTYVNLTYLASLKKLKKLTCNYLRNPIGREEVSFIERAVGLKRQCFLASLSEAAPQLTHISLEGSLYERMHSLSNFIRFADLSPLKEFTQIEGLNVKDNNLTDSHLKEIARVTSLVYLDISGEQGFTDQGFDQLSSLKNLRELKVTRVGNWLTGYVPSKQSIIHLKEKIKGLEVYYST